MLMTLTGIQLTTVAGGGVGLPAVTAMYSGPAAYPRSIHCSDAAAVVKSVQFNTVHNCEQLSRAPPSGGSPLRNVDEDLTEGPGLAATAQAPGQSLPASYRCRGATEAGVQAQASTPTATINRHYAVQPRTLYRPSADSQPGAATACRDWPGAGCPTAASMTIGNGPLLSPQCTMSDSGCVSPPTTRLRHYCV